MLYIDSPAKINLFLEVTGKRDDGLHNIESVFLEIDFMDRLAVEPAPTEISLVCDYPDLPTGADNLVVKAANTLKRIANVRSGARFHLDKRIPFGSGLGGGSSNAATALRLANRLWDTGLSDIELAAIGAMVGADVPFFLYGGICLCRGKGEIIESLLPLPEDVTFGLVLSRVHSDTAAAYRGLVLPSKGNQRRADAFITAAAVGDVTAMADLAFNRFESTVFPAFPVLADIHARLEDAGISARLSGSGSALWFLGPVENARKTLAGIEGVKVLEVRAYPRNIPSR